MAIEVRRARLADLPAIQQFIRLAYEDLAPFKAKDRWRWQFLDNPFVPPAEGQMPVWIACDEDEVVGQIAVQGTDLQVNGRLHRAGWIVDVMILPAWRGRGLGHRLHAAVADNVPVLLTLTMAPATRRMAEQGGAITLGPTRQWSRWGRLQAMDVLRYLVQRTRHHRGLAQAVRLACDGMAAHRLFAGLVSPLLAARRSPAGAGPAAVSIRESEGFGAETNSLWAHAAPGYAAICPRRARFLNWRFRDCPQLHYRIFHAWRGETAVGYSVLRRAFDQELRQGIIVDVFAERDDANTYHALLVHAVALFGEEVASVECATSLPLLAGLLRAADFFPTRRLAPTVVVADPALRAEIAAAPQAWFFSKADHDWDQVHLA